MTLRKVRDREVALPSTRYACATRTQACSRGLNAAFKLRNDPSDHRGAGLSSVVASQGGLLPWFAYDSCLSLHLYGGRKTADCGARLGRRDHDPPWRDRAQNGFVGSFLGRRESWSG